MSESKDGFNVKVYGCIQKELKINQPKITLQKISKILEIDEKTSYVVDGKVLDPNEEIQLHDGIELECRLISKVEPIYHVKVFGCTQKELEFDKQIVTLSEVSKKAGLSEDTLYIIDGKSESASTEITLTDGIELECKKLGRDS